MTPSIVVVGAGPAGMAAATEAAATGASVTLLDEQEEPGGQLRYRVQPVTVAAGSHADRPDRIAERLVDAALAAGVGFRTNATVAGCFAGLELLVVEDGVSSHEAPDCLIVATGSTDLPYPFAGATYPGVFSARGLQILLNLHRVRPGRRFAIIGSAADAEELAGDVMLAGGEVVWSGVAPAPFLSSDGAEGVRGLTVGQDHYTVDVIAIAVGRQADPALATMVGTPLAFSTELGGLIPLIDDHLRSPISGLFVAGDAAGVGSVAAVIAEGRLAGIAAAASLGLASDEDVAAVHAAGGPELAWRLAQRAALPAVSTQPYQ
jgi:NADPH-dependent 2,4-dienoyl-CoA reductase/sulfur reductase-like enzyme